jgi:hypothetical protein
MNRVCNFIVTYNEIYVCVKLRNTYLWDFFYYKSNTKIGFSFLFLY